MKNLVIRLIIVCIFIIGALLIINSAPKYELLYKYKDGDLRVIINDVEITRDTRRLPEVAVLLNNEVLLSQNTIDYLFDKNLHTESKRDMLVTTSDTHIAYITVGSKTILIDGEEKGIKVPAVKDTYEYATDDRYTDKKDVKSIIYVPIKELCDVYDIDVKFEDKLIITERNVNRSRVTVTGEEPLEIKYLKDDNSKTIKKVINGDFVDIFNYASFEEYNQVRSSDGEIGFVKTEILEKFGVSPVTTKQDIPSKTDKKINIAWDYINPDNTSIGDKADRTKIEVIDVVAPTLLYLQNTDGEVKFKINAVKEYISWANKNGYKIWFTFKNDSNSIDETSEFLNDNEHRSRAIYELIEIAKAYKIDGINVDFENMYKKDAECFSQFIRELSVVGHWNNLVISVCVNVPDGSETWSLCYEHKNLSEAADYLAVMTYDQYGQSSKVAGPNASYDWVETNIQKLVEREGVDRQKVLLGIAFYSRLWTKDVFPPAVVNMDKAKTYINGATWSDTAKQYYYENNAKTKQIWVEDATSIKEKLKLISDYDLGGSAAWRLGFESDDVWEAYK